MRLYTLLILICLGYTAKVKAQDSNAVIAKMLKSIDNCKTLQFDIETRERFGDEYFIGQGKVKLRTAPHQLYMKQLAPNPGIEILYSEGKNKNKALVKPKGPMMALLLSPNSGKMRKYNHHSILEIGFRNIAELIRNTKKNANPKITISETTGLDNKPVLLLAIDFDDYSYQEVVLEEDTRLVDLANAKGISAYKVYEKNNLKSFSTLKKGTTLKLPTRYCSTIELYIDKSTFLPTSQAMYDELGLFERYDYTNIKVNPKFSADEFSKTFKGYSF